MPSAPLQNRLPGLCTCGASRFLPALVPAYYWQMTSPAPGPKPIFDFLKSLTVGNDTHGKAAPPTPDLVHSQCTAVSGGSSSQGLQPSARPCSHAFLCSWSRHLHSEASLLGPLVEPFSVASAETFLSRRGGILKTLFLYSDPVLTTFLFPALPFPCCSARTPTPSIKLEEPFV